MSASFNLKFLRFLGNAAISLGNIVWSDRKPNMSTEFVFVKIDVK